MPQDFNTPPEWAKALISKVDTMTSKLNKLDKIEQAVCEMKTMFDNLTLRVVEVEKSQKFISESFESSKKESVIQSRELNQIKSKLDKVMSGNHALSEEIESSKKVIETLRSSKQLPASQSREIHELKSKLDETMLRNNALSDTVLDLQFRSMRDNLLFFGVDEFVPTVISDEEMGQGEVADVAENCVEVVRKIILERMEISDPVTIDRAHRIGSKQVNKVRPIVVKFNQFQHRETVRKSSIKLKNSNIYVREQYPKAIQDSRKLLWPIYKKAKDEKKKAYFVKDKLYIEGKLYSETPESTRVN